MAKAIALPAAAAFALRIACRRLPGPESVVVVTVIVVTVIEKTAAPTPWSLSVAVAVTTYGPTVSGVKLGLAPEPEANATPFLVTNQAKVNPAARSAALASVAVTVRLIGAPGELTNEATASVTVGAVLRTVKLA